MPIIPTYETQQGLSAEPTPRVQLDDGIGQALTRVGTATMAAADRFQERAKQQAAASASDSFDYLNENLNQKLIEAQRTAPVDGRGLAEGFISNVVSPEIEKTLKGITDPEIRQRAVQRARLLAEKYSNDAANTEWKIGNEYDTTRSQESWDATQQGINQQPALVKQYVDDQIAFIDARPNLTTAQKEDFKAKIRAAAPGVVAGALQTQDPETLYFYFGQGSHDERVAFLSRRLVGAIGTDPMGVGFNESKIAAAVNRQKGDVQAALVDLVQGPDAVAKWKENGRVLKDASAQDFIDRTVAHLGTASLISGEPKYQGTGDAVQSAASMIAGFEGLRLEPYWDVNHHRIGFGSDTVTKADGTVLTTQPGMNITREDAVRDLNRRVGIIQRTIAGQIGDAWGSLSGSAQAALTSVAYNYGKLPDNVLAAAQTGDKGKIANAIISLSGHNAGVNAKRRREEAMAVIHGTPGTGLPPTSDSPVQVGGAPRSGFLPEIVADMPVSELQRWQGVAGNLRLKSADQQKIELDMLKVQTTQSMDDDIASIKSTGQGAIGPEDIDATEQQIVTAHGIDRLAKFREDRLVAQNVFDLTQQAGQLPEAALQQRLEQLEPKGGEGSAVQQRVYDGVKANVDDLLAQRKADPSQAAIDHFPAVADAWSKVVATDPSTVENAIQQTIDAQKVMGVAPENIVPLPAPYAKRIADQVRNEEAPVDTRVGMLMNTVFLTEDPAQQEQVLRQLAKNGLPIGIANVAEAYKRGDVGATRRLFQAAMLDPSKAPKLGSNDSTLGTAVEDAMLGTGSIGQAFYGLDLGDPKSGDVAASDLELAKAETRLLMAGGTGQQDAIDQAVKDIFGPVEVLDEGLISGAQVRGLVDEGTDRAALLRGFDAATNGKMVDVMQGYIARAYGQLPANATPQMQAIFRASHINEMNRVLGQGVWRNNGRGWGFYDPEKQSFVSDDTGKPITFTTDEIIKLGDGSTEAPPSNDLFNPAPVAPPPADSGFGIPPTPANEQPPAAPGKMGMIKAPATDPVGQLKEQGQSLLANGPLKDPMQNPALGDVALSQAGTG